MVNKYTSKRACSPVRARSPKKGGKNKVEHFDTCFTYDALKEIALAFNKAHSRSKTIKPIIIRKTKKALWKAIKERMDQKGVCQGEGEWCWIHQPFVKRTNNQKILKLTFKPPIPQGKYDWLSTEDIDRVMHQYEHVIPSFKFMGTWPRDFKKMARKKFVTDFDIKKLKKKGITHVGLVINEDLSHQSGSHWVAVMIDIPKKQAQFYDSYADPPPREIKNWVKHINSTLSAREKPFEIVWNDVRHQFANSECGVYSMHFLVLRAMGVPFKNIVRKAIKDEKMNEKRRGVFFNPYNPYNNSI